ncbi:OmpA family protein [Methylobacterium sp. NEAU 140]|uniref:OmpA family protein n=1 Tax=Methylobacterium sp. NEAU 140 TaxID=3064945 RepID=UPI002732C750|nr:OmpA family protein [Methylobacterium sp. NEAU 140]MDP4026445.1 OmpA family protein [Methylobacterium sp. NEAU 140]
MAATLVLTGLLGGPACTQSGPEPPKHRLFLVFFTGGGGAVPARFDPDLREAACYMAPGAAVRIRGYADRTGAPDDNLRLSELRATNVANAIGRYGVSCDRLEDRKGLGEENGPNQSGNGPYSRRVEVYVAGTLPTGAALAACMARPAPTPVPSPCIPPR